MKRKSFFFIAGICFLLAAVLGAIAGTKLPESMAFARINDASKSDSLSDKNQTNRTKFNSRNKVKPMAKDWIQGGSGWSYDNDSNVVYIEDSTARIGIGVTNTSLYNSAYNLYVKGKTYLRGVSISGYSLPDTAAATGYVLQTDGRGNLEWALPSGLPSGTEGQTLRNSNSSGDWVANSNLLNDGTHIGVGLASFGAGDTYKLNVNGSVNLSAGKLYLGGIATANKLLKTDGNGALYWADTTTAGAGGTVTSITANSPLTGGTITASGSIGIPAANGSTNGYLSSSDWTTFNNKGSGTVTSITAGTGISTSPTTITTSGTISLSTPVAIDNGGTGLATTPTTGQLLIGNGSTIVNNKNKLTYSIRIVIIYPD